MGLRDIGATLPPGFRFYPSDEELVCHYLYKKVTHEEALKGTLVEIDLHTCEPWQLPGININFHIYMYIYKHSNILSFIFLNIFVLPLPFYIMYIWFVEMRIPDKVLGLLFFGWRFSDNFQKRKIDEYLQMKNWKNTN